MRLVTSRLARRRRASLLGRRPARIVVALGWLVSACTDPSAAPEPVPTPERTTAADRAAPPTPPTPVPAAREERSLRVTPGYVARSLYVAKDAVFWLETSPDGTACTLRSSPFSTEDRALSKAVSTEANRVVVSSTNVLVGDWDRIVRFDRDGEMLGTVFEPPRGAITDFALAEESVYVVVDEKTVQLVPVAGGEATTVVKADGPIGELVRFRGHLYWSALAAGELRRIPLGGGELEVVYEGDLEPPLAVAGNELVFAERRATSPAKVVWFDPSTRNASGSATLGPQSGVRGLTTITGVVLARLSSAPAKQESIVRVSPSGTIETVTTAASLGLPRTHGAPVLFWLDASKKDVQSRPVAVRESDAAAESPRP